MSHPQRSRQLGFVLIEALIALMLIAVGLVAVSKLQVLSLSGAGEAKSRSEAVVESQKKLEDLRNIVLKASYTGAPMVTGSTTIVGTNATYAMAWTVTPDADTTLEQTLIQLTTTWTDARNVSQRLDLNSLIAWDDPGSQIKLNAPTTPQALISPTGSATRGTGQYTSTTGTANADGSRIYQDGTTTRLLSSTGAELLSLPPKNGTAQNFTTITGRIYFDESAGNNAIPNANNVKVRLSSEGECVFNNAVANLTSVPSSGTALYKYFTYTCYVGPGWYGNVGVVIDDSVSGQAASPTICVGDPAFNGGVSDSTLISAHPVEAAVRSYRGFKGSSGAYFSTGVAGGRKYGLSDAQGVSNQTAPFDGRPIPSAYPAYYPTVTAGGTTDYFDQDFLITRISGNGSCYSKMSGGYFTPNAGKYVCINPDNDTAADVCPPIWPGFEGAVGSGGSINYTLTVAPAGNGSGTVTSSPSGISCGSSCLSSFASGTSVTLTAVAASGSTFASWSGCDSTSGATCTISVIGALTVIPTFNPVASTTYDLTTATTGTGTGTITSADGLINCGTTCLASYASGSSVVLTATATTGSFAGWSGCTSTSGNTCTVTMSASTAVTATFATTSYTLTVTKAGTGSGAVASAPTGISCGSACSASFGSGTSVVLAASPIAGSSFTGWSGGGCSGTGTCTVTMSAAQSVTATFALNTVCTTPISGTAHDKFGTVTISGNSGGSCAMDGGNTSTYTCSSVTAPSGTIFTLTNSRTTGNPSDHYSYSVNATATCGSQTNVNFP